MHACRTVRHAGWQRTNLRDKTRSLVLGNRLQTMDVLVGPAAAAKKSRQSGMVSTVSVKGVSLASLGSCRPFLGDINHPGTLKEALQASPAPVKPCHMRRELAGRSVAPHEAHARAGNDSRRYCMRARFVDVLAGCLI